MKNADSKTILEVCKELKKDKDKLRAEVMFVAAIRLYDLGQKDEAVYWFYTAQYQARVFMSILEVNRDGLADESVGANQPYIAFLALLGPYINKYAMRDPAKLEKTLKTVVDEGKSLPKFRELYPEVAFSASDSWAEKNQKIRDGLNELIAMVKKKQNGGEVAEPPLIQRIKAGDTAGAEKLINEGADVNAAGENRETALLATIRAGNKEIFISLLKHGADPNARGDDRWTPMHRAAGQRDTFWLSKLLAHGGNTDVVNTGNPHFPKQTPLYSALTRQSPAAVKILVDAKANINFKEYYGKSPVFYAVEFTMYSSAKLLIEKGADPKLWAQGKRSIFPGNGWFNREFGEEVEPASKQAEYYELYDFLADKGHLPPRDKTRKAEDSEKKN